MSVLKNFKNIPLSPYGGATGLKCNFFFKFATKSLEEKKRSLSPTPGATGQWARLGGRSPLSPPPPRATGSGHLYKASSSFPPLI